MYTLFRTKRRPEEAAAEPLGRGLILYPGPFGNSLLVSDRTCVVPTCSCRCSTGILGCHTVSARMFKRYNGRSESTDIHKREPQTDNPHTEAASHTEASQTRRPTTAHAAFLKTINLTVK